MMRSSEKDQHAGLWVEPRLVADVQRTRARMTRNASAASLADSLPLAVLFLTPWGLAYRLEWISGAVLAVACLVALTFIVTRMVRALSRRPSLLKAALHLDAQSDLKGRLSAALSFSGCFETTHLAKDSGDFAAVAIEEARDIGTLSPQKAVPLDLPSGILWGGAMLSLFGLVVYLPLVSSSAAPSRSLLSPPAAQNIQWIAPDDVELLKESLTSVEEVAESAEAKEIAERFNQLIVQAQAGEIDQAQALRLAADLEAELQAGAAQSDALREALKERGEKLQGQKITREVGDALAEARVKDAEEALRKLAERLTSGAQPLSQNELDELRKSLSEVKDATQKGEQEASASTDMAEAESRLKKERERLLQKKQQGKASQQDLDRLAQTERQLKKLSRQKKSAETQKSLSELDKQLAQAARELSQEQKKSGQFLDQAADSLADEQEKHLSDKEKQELLKQLKALKERLRRQNQEGSQEKRLREFQQRARGQDPDKGGQAKPGKGRKSGGKPGSMSLQMGKGAVNTPSQVEGADGSDSGKKPGSSHDPQLEGDSTHLLSAKTEDKTAVAQDSGQGESASETIASVAEEGFTRGSYERLFQEYQTVAEEVMEKERIPAGRKSHVQRYFELIRPREEDTDKVRNR